jgi:hypothetical protein
MKLLYVVMCQQRKKTYFIMYFKYFLWATIFPHGSEINDVAKKTTWRTQGDIYIVTFLPPPFLDEVAFKEWFIG